MKKNSSIKMLTKSPPIMSKTFKSNQKYLFTSMDNTDTFGNNQTLRNRIENVNKSLNEEIKQREFQFKELYKMINELQKSKKSKCKHNILIMERNTQGTQHSHIPLSFKQKNGYLPLKETQNNRKQHNEMESSNLDLSHKNIGSSKQFNDFMVMKKQKRKQKCGTIKSHKHLPGINSSYNSNSHFDIQNQEEIQKIQYSNLQTNSSQFFNCTESKLYTQTQEFVSPTKSLLSTDKGHKSQLIEQLSLKINFFDKKIKSLQASQSFIQQRLDNQIIKNCQMTDKFKVLSQKLDTSSKNCNQTIKILESQMSKNIQVSLKQIQDQHNNKTDEQIQKMNKGVQQSLMQRLGQQINLKMGQMTIKLTENLKTQSNELNQKYQKYNSNMKDFQKTHNLKFQNFQQKIILLEKQLITPISQLKNMFKEQIETLQNKIQNINLKLSTTQCLSRQIFTVFINQTINKVVQQKFDKKQLLSKQYIDQIVKEQIKKNKQSQQNQNLQTNLDLNKNPQINQDIYSFKISEIQERLENTEQIVSQLMKVSLTLTTKIKSNIYDFNLNGQNKQKQKKIGKLSQQYWKLKQELSMIDEEIAESSCSIIDQSLLDMSQQLKGESCKQVTENKNEQSLITYQQSQFNQQAILPLTLIL